MIRIAARVKLPFLRVSNWSREFDFERLGQGAFGVDTCKLWCLGFIEHSASWEFGLDSRLQTLFHSHRSITVAAHSLSAFPKMDLNSLKDTVAGLSLYDLKAGVRKVQNGTSRPHWNRAPHHHRHANTPWTAVMNYTEMEAKVCQSISTAYTEYRLLTKPCNRCGRRPTMNLGVHLQP